MKGPNPTVMEAVKLSEEYLGRHGVESARLSAEHLLARALGCSRLDLYLKFDNCLDSDTLEKYRSDLKKRAGHYPLQYMLGEVEFMSLRFKVREGVFIPRPETERLVDRVEEASAGMSEVSFIELGTGTGIISASLAARNPGWSGVAFDVSPLAAALAKENLGALGVSGRVSVFASEGFSAVSDGARFDILISNPPYVPSSSIDGLQKEVSVYENRTALDGGDAGLGFYPMLAEAGSRLLKPGGLIALEIGEGQSDRIVEMLVRCGYGPVEAKKDYNGIYRTVTAFVS